MRIIKSLILFICLFLGAHGFAQNVVTVSGVVTDKNSGEPLIGVNVVDKNSPGNGTITDFEGNYSLSLSSNSTLVFSFIGYLETQVQLKGQTVVNVALAENVQELETVVVVGAVMRKSDLTGAAARVSEKDLKAIPTANVNQALQGKVPGVYIETNPKPGANASIKIRGTNSIKYGTDPIYVVDNVMIDGGFESINPDDIASIDILKDATATALYGARGANGVVVITTKKGAKGEGKVTYDAWFGSQRFTKDMPMLSANDVFDLRVDAYANSYMDKNPNANREKYINDYLITERMNRNLIFSAEEWAAHEAGESYYWLDEIVRNGFQQNHSVSLSGGNDNGNYYASFGYNDQKGQIRNTGYQRYTGKLNLEQSVKPWLRLGSNNSFVYSDERPVGDDNTFINSLRANPLLEISEDYWYMKEGKIDNQSSSNPLRDLYIEKKNYQTRFISSNFININVLKDFDFRSTFSFDVLQREEYTYYPTNTSQSYKETWDGKAIHKKQRKTNWQWDNTIAYNKVFNDVHRLSAVLGTNMSYYGDDWNNAEAPGFGNDLFGYKSLGGATKKEDFQLSSDFTGYTLMSYLARFNYVYDSRYYLTVTGRYDGSSRFGKNNKWGFFPSVAGSWNITNEAFMMDQRIFSDLRLRVGYGLAGNQNIPNYGYLTRFSPSSSLGQNILVNNEGMYGNPDLKWETQKQLNAGIDISVLNNRVNMVLDAFYIRNDDLLMEKNLEGSSGYKKQLANVGSLENKGIEFSINAVLINNKDFRWDAGFNISAARNKIRELYDGMEVIYKLGGWSNNEIQREENLFVGKSINNLYVYKFDRIVQESDMDYVNSLDLGDRVVRPGDILPYDRNGDGIINDEDRYVVGKKDPNFYGGVSTTFSYKGLSLNIIGNYSVGGKRNSYLYETLMGSIGNSGAHADLINRWTPENTNTDIPRAYSDGGRFGLSEVDWAVQDASFFRLSAVTLSYTLPSQWLKPLRIDNLRVYATGNNLVTATKYKGFDPEGGDWYPFSKMYIFGLNLSF